ncbi:hypothetical protein Tco_0345253 [Tanacetum coccineum]
MRKIVSKKAGEDIKSVLTQKGLDTFCQTFHIPDDVHPRPLFPKPKEFRADDFAVYVAHPAPFRKFPEPFLCLIGISRTYTLDKDTYPTFLHDDGTQRWINLAFISCGSDTHTGESRRTGACKKGGMTFVSLLGGADQGNSTAGVGQETEAEIVSGVRNDHGTSSGAASVGKSPTVLKQLLASSILNAENLSVVYSSDLSKTNLVTNFPRAEDESIIRGLLWFSPPVYLKRKKEAVITTHVASIPFVTAPESGTKVITPVHDSMFQDSESTGMVRPDTAGSSHLPGKELSLRSWVVDSESLHEVFVPRWNIPNDSLLDNLDASKEFIDHLAPLVLFA